MDAKKEIGKRIAVIRVSKKYTQEAFAHKLGIKRSHIADTERGKIFPNFELLEKIHNIFGIDLNNLICYTGNTKATIKNLQIAEEGKMPYTNAKLIELYEENRNLMRENIALKKQLDSMSGTK